MEPFAKKLTAFSLYLFSQKHSILHAWQGSEYTFKSFSWELLKTFKEAIYQKSFQCPLPHYDYMIILPLGKDLKCEADIIREIPLMEKVTPPMLVSAQACVAKSMEENW